MEASVPGLAGISLINRIRKIQAWPAKRLCAPWAMPFFILFQETETIILCVFQKR